MFMSKTGGKMKFLTNNFSGVNNNYNTYTHIHIYSSLSLIHKVNKERDKMATWSLKHDVIQNFMLQESKPMLVLPPNCNLIPREMFSKRGFTWTQLLPTSTWHARKLPRKCFRPRNIMKHPKKQAYKFPENKFSGVVCDTGTNWTIQVILSS